MYKQKAKELRKKLQVRSMGGAYVHNYLKLVEETGVIGDRSNWEFAERFARDSRSLSAGRSLEKEK